MIGALRTRRHVALATAVAAAALGAASVAWRSEHPNRDGRVVVLDARTGAVVGERGVSGGWVVVALLPHRQVAIADADGCRAAPIRIFDDHLRLLRTSRSAYACDIAQPGQLRARLRAGQAQAATSGYWSTPAGLNHALARGRLVVRPDGVLIAYDARGRVLWRRRVGRPAALPDVGEGRVVATVAGTYTPPPSA